MRALAAALALLALAGCTADPVRIGSKEFAESRILAEMFALLLEEKGIPVERQYALGATPVVFEALKTGAIDLYPEYTGTGLALLGGPRIADPQGAFSAVAAAFAPHGMRFLDPLGFETGYVVLTRPRLARQFGLERIADLGPVAGRLDLAVSQSFAERPRDGLGPFLDGFGLDFDGISVVPDADRGALYDALVEERADVVIGFSTDPEIADYGLRRLADAGGFFAAYEAAPLVSEAALARRPEIGEALAALAGRLDAARVREMNAAVRFDGRPLRLVARQALFDLGLVETPPRERVPRLAIATDPATIGSDAANRTLRAVRRAMRGRDIDLSPATDPLEAIAAREARMALAPAIAAFAVDGTTAARKEGFEVIAAVGSTFVHALTRADDPVAPGAAERIAAGPEGSPSNALARAVAATRAPPAQVVPLDLGDGLEAATAVLSGEADVALVIATPGRIDLREVLATTPGLTLVAADGWWQGGSRLALPFLREARIPAGTYAGVDRPVQTLAMQLALFGPAPPERFVIGRQGPSTFSDDLLPVSHQTVLAIDRTLGRHPAVDPHLPRSAALDPPVQLRDERLNPDPDRAVLTLAILAYLAFAGWLLVRPVRGG